MREDVSVLERRTEVELEIAIVLENALGLELSLGATIDGGREGPVDQRDHPYRVLASCGTHSRWSAKLDERDDPESFGVDRSCCGCTASVKVTR